MTVLLHCLSTGEHYPEVPDAPPTGQPRYAAVGDLINASEADARALIADGLAYAVCRRCMTPLDAELRCPNCFEGESDYA